MSKTKSGGKTRQHTTRPGKRLGVKIYGGQKIATGQIIMRQRGTKVHAGDNVGLGRDHTLYAKKTGSVKFSIRQGRQFAAVI